MTKPSKITTLALVAFGAVAGWAMGAGYFDFTGLAKPAVRQTVAEEAPPVVRSSGVGSDHALLAEHNRRVSANIKQDDKKPNICVIWGDDIGQSNISTYSNGLMGYSTPNIDRIAKEGMLFTDYYAEQSCTAGRSSFITGQHGLRTGLTKVGFPGATIGLQAEDPTIAELLKPLGYATGQFGKNHLGDRNQYLPTVHGFDEFYGNLYHLNAEEEPEHPDYPKDPEFRAKFGPRGVDRKSVV